jgi:hypothetical protein
VATTDELVAAWRPADAADGRDGSGAA